MVTIGISFESIVISVNLAFTCDLLTLSTAVAQIVPLQLKESKEEVR